MQCLNCRHHSSGDDTTNLTGSCTATLLLNAKTGYTHKLAELKYTILPKRSRPFTLQMSSVPQRRPVKFGFVKVAKKEREKCADKII